jgi:hypothetical protein
MTILSVCLDHPAPFGAGFLAGLEAPAIREDYQR